MEPPDPTNQPVDRREDLRALIRTIVPGEPGPGHRRVALPDPSRLALQAGAATRVTIWAVGEPADVHGVLPQGECDLLRIADAASACSLLDRLAAPALVLLGAAIEEPAAAALRQALARRPDCARTLLLRWGPPPAPMLAPAEGPQPAERHPEPGDRPLVRLPRRAGGAKRWPRA